MHHRDEANYRHFCALIAKKPNADNRECIQHVMRAGGHTADPNMITDWWRGWQIMRAALSTGMHGRLGESDAVRNMAIGILRAVDVGRLDSRSMAADALMNWTAIYYDVNDGSGIRRFREETGDVRLTAPAAPAPPHTGSPAP